MGGPALPRCGAPSLPAGFPIRSTHPEHPGFVGQAAQGLNATPEHPVLCPQSLLPGGCAVGSLDEAFSVCLGTPNCRSIVQYWNGTSGCGGPPLAVLVTTPLSRATGWVAPSVDTFIRYDLNFTVRRFGLTRRLFFSGQPLLLAAGVWNAQALPVRSPLRTMV